MQLKNRLAYSVARELSRRELGRTPSRSSTTTFLQAFLLRPRPKDSKQLSITVIMFDVEDAHGGRNEYISAQSEEPLLAEKDAGPVISRSGSQQRPRRWPLYLHGILILLYSAVFLVLLISNGHRSVCTEGQAGVTRPHRPRMSHSLCLPPPRGFLHQKVSMLILTCRV